MGSPDLDRVLRMVLGLNEDASGLHACVVEGAPQSKGRPRFTRTGKPYQAREDRLAERAMKDRLALTQIEPSDGNIAVACVFFRPNRQRIDTDNMVKFVLDCANGILWFDDSQVTGLVAVTELDPIRPRTVIAVAPHVSTLRREIEWRSCRKCEAPFEIKSNNLDQVYCSARCRQDAARLAAYLPCPVCAAPFRRKTSGQQTCSRACSVVFKTGRAKGDRGLPNCSDCGKTLSKAGYVRCRACWAKARGSGLDSQYDDVRLFEGTP